MKRLLLGEVGEAAVLSGECGAAEIDEDVEERERALRMTLISFA